VVEVGIFQRGVGHFKSNCQMGGDIAHQHLLVSEN